MSETAASRRSIGAKQNPEAAAAILDTAARLLAEKGLKGLTTDAIAREARASKTTLYRWWPTRGALLLAVYMRMKRDHIHPDTGSLTGDVAAVLRQLFGFWRGEGRVFGLILAEAQSDAALIPELDRFREERAAEWAPALARAAGRGELRADVSPAALPEAIMAHAWFHLLTGRLDADPAALAEQITRPFLRAEA